MFNRKNSTQDMDAYVEERLSDFLDGTLSDKERAIVQAHLATSERARASLEALRYTVNLLKQTPAPALPRQFTLPVTSRAPVQSAPGWLVWGLRGVGVAATAAFVILLVATLTRPGDFNSSAGTTNLPQTAPGGNVALAQPTALPANTTVVVSEAFDANPTPIMQTEEPSAVMSQPVPLTVTPTTAVQKSAPPPQDSDTAAATLPPPTLAPAPLLVDTPEPTGIAAASGAAANSSAPAESSEPTATGEVLTQRSAIVTLEGQVTLSELIVRAGPGTEYAVIGGLRRGDVVRVMGRSEDYGWLWVAYQRNLKERKGWVSSAYVVVNGKLDSLPITEFGKAETPTVTPEPTETAIPVDGAETPDNTNSTPTVDEATPDAPPTPDTAPTEIPGRTSTTPAAEGTNTETPTPAPTEAGESEPTATPVE